MGSQRVRQDRACMQIRPIHLPLSRYLAGASLVAQLVKCLPAVRETRFLSLGWEDPLEKEMATHSSTLAWKIPWTEEPGRLQSMGSQTDTTERLHFTADKAWVISVGVDLLLDGFHLVAVARPMGFSWKWAYGRSTPGPRWGWSAPLLSS